MAITFGAIGTTADFTEFKDFSGVLTSFSINKPTNVVSGNYALLRVNTKQPAGSTSTFTPPAGFTAIANNFTSDAEFRAHMWVGYRKIDGSEGSSFSVSWAAGAGTQTANDIYATCQRIQGADGTTFLGSNVATFNDDATASPINNSITTTVANAVAVFCYAAYGTMATQDANYPTGTTGQYVRDNGGGGFSIGQAVQTIASASATGTRTWTNVLAGTPYWATVAFAINPAGAAAAVLSAPTPSGTLGTQTTATIGATTNQNTGTFYCVVDSAANLSGVSVAQIKAGQKASGAAALAAANSSITTTSPSAGVTGLTAGTLYSYSIVQNNGNGDSNIVAGTFTTAAATYAASISLVDGTGAAYASSSFNWVAYSDFGITKTGNGTTSTNGSGVLAVSGVTASGSGWVIGKLASNALIVFATAVTFA